MHPNVPFLAKHPAWGALADATAQSDSPSRAGGWDRGGLGWSGFLTSDRLLLKLWGWLGLGVIAVVAVGSIVADPQRLTEMLKLAVTPLAVLLGFSAQSWPEASSRADPSHGEAATERHIALFLLGTAGAGSINHPAPHVFAQAQDDPLYRARKLLVSASERITDNGHTHLRGLLDAGDPYGEARDAWHR